LSLLLHQYEDLDHKVLVANFDSALASMKIRDISDETLDEAGKQLLQLDPDQLARDVVDLEGFLQEEADRVKYLLGDLLNIHERAGALNVLGTEKLSSMVRASALAALLADLLSSGAWKAHEEVMTLLVREEAPKGRADLFSAGTESPPLVLRRSTEEWTRLKDSYRRAFETIKLTAEADRAARELSLVKAENLEFDTFDRAWRKEGLAKLDFYLSDVGRTLRLEQVKPLPERLLWAQFNDLWLKARESLDRLKQSAVEALNKINGRFQDLYATRYASWVRDNKAPAVFTHQFVPRFLKPHWDPRSGPKAYLLIFDGMRVDAWQEFLLPLFLERFEVVEERAGSALIPTETNLSRKAISAGCLPAEFVAAKENVLLEAALRRHIGIDVDFEVQKDKDDQAAGIAVRYSSPRLEVVIFNFTDNNLHGNKQELALIYGTTVRTIIEQDVRSVLRDIEDDAMVFVTSDHGFIPTVDHGVKIPEQYLLSRHDVHYHVAWLHKPLSGRISDEAVQFPVSDLGLGGHSREGHTHSHVAFPKPGRFLKRPKWGGEPDQHTHGGLSLGECLVPVVCLGPRSDKALPIRLEEVVVDGSLMEGENVAVIITMHGAPKGVRIVIDLTDAERDETRSRTELFPGGSKTYRMPWRLPRIEKPTQEEVETSTAVRPMSVTVHYRKDGKPFRTSKTVDVRIHLDSTRLRRPGSSKLDTVLGLMPKRS